MKLFFALNLSAFFPSEIGHCGRSSFKAFFQGKNKSLRKLLDGKFQKTPLNLESKRPHSFTKPTINTKQCNTFPQHHYAKLKIINKANVVEKRKEKSRKMCWYVGRLGEALQIC